MSQHSTDAIVLYWSAGGNTRKAAEAIHEALTGAGRQSELREITADLDVDLSEVPLIFFGAPVYGCLAPEPVMDFLKRGRPELPVLPAAPERPGQFVVPFGTYGGPHTGYGEAVPMLKYIGQKFEHWGIRVIDEWAWVGEFHHPSRLHLNTEGRLGDITGRPNEHDLAEVRQRVIGLLRRIGRMRGG